MAGAATFRHVFNCPNVSSQGSSASVGDVIEARFGSHVGSGGSKGSKQVPLKPWQLLGWHFLVVEVRMAPYISASWGLDGCGSKIG